MLLNITPQPDDFLPNRGRRTWTHKIGFIGATRTLNMATKINIVQRLNEA
jgi:hypothetical protein